MAPLNGARRITLRKVGEHYRCYQNELGEPLVLELRREELIEKLDTMGCYLEDIDVCLKWLNDFSLMKSRRN